MQAKAKNPFNFPRRARYGTIILLVVLATLLIAWRSLPDVSLPDDDLTERELEQAWQNFLLTNTHPETEKEQRIYAKANVPDVQLFYFDPNTADSVALLKLGLKPRTVSTLLKYRLKGGRFRKPEDLQKLYTLGSEDYKRLAPYVRIIPVDAEGRKYSRQEVIVQRKETIELNTADSGSLLRLKGIGPVLSGRIIRFRDGLGGFLKVEQLKEVFGLPDSTYREVIPLLKVDPSQVKTINLNTATDAQLARHPYIGKRIAPAIIRLRNDLGTFKEIEQIRSVPLINDEKYRKIAPYLTID